MKRILVLLISVLLALALAAPMVSAQSGSVVVDTSPGTAAPPATLGSYTMTPFENDSRALFELVNDVPAPNGGTLQFDRSVGHYEATPDTGWGTWSHGYTGDVYSNWFESSPTRDQVVMTLPKNTSAFYFYAEPNFQGIYNVTATASDGTTSGPVAVNGLAGARYFGFYTTAGATLSTITVDVDPNANGFALGEFGVDEASGTTAPIVDTVSPVDETTRVARDTNITATFSEKMDRDSITKSTFKLYKCSSTTSTDCTKQVTKGTVKLSSDGLTATLNPYGKSDTKLAKNTKYKATVTTEAKDMEGTALDQQKDWYFTTGGK